MPSRLIGMVVDVRLYADHIEVYYKGHLVESMERVHGTGEAQIDYRHIIGSLVRKPGAFARYRFREQMFPTQTFRLAYDALCGWRGERADVEYVRILHLAATTMESKVTGARNVARVGTEVRLRDGAQAVGASATSGTRAEAVRYGGPWCVRPAAVGRCAMMVDTGAPSAVRNVSGSCSGSSSCPRWQQRPSVGSARPVTRDALVTLMELMEQEAEDRRVRRVDRLRKASKLPAGKTWDTFEHDRTSIQLRQQLQRLGEGDFVDRGVNVLAFGMPGTGKTHAICAIGHRLVESGALGAVHPRISTGAGHAGREERPRSAQDAQEAGQLRPPGDRRPGLPAAGSRGVGGAVHPDSRALRAQVSWGNLEPGVQRVGEGVRKPHGDSGGHRQDRPPLGDPGVRRAEL